MLRSAVHNDVHSFAHNHMVRGAHVARAAMAFMHLQLDAGELAAAAAVAVSEALLWPARCAVPADDDFCGDPAAEGAPRHI